jgi:threonine dehydrogenase-like Zn-dependent dehydrogenase
MRAVVFEREGVVRIADVPEPTIEEPGDAVVRVSRVAICGSDLHFLHGKAPIDPGDVLGHEAMGVLEVVGEGVQRFRPGERVAIAFQLACGRCWFCERGQTALCDDSRTLGAGAFGGGLPGAQAELVRVPAADVNLLALPDDVDDDRGMFVGDALTTAYYVTSIGEIQPGDTVAVVGAGPVGYFCVQSALALGAGRVLALDRVPSRLELVAGVGAEPIDVTLRHPVTAVAEASGGRGADVVVEAVGNVGAYATAIEAARRGGRVVLVGVYADESVDVQLGVYWARGLTLRFAGLTPIHAWWDRVLAEVAGGRLDPSPIVSHRLPLEEAARGYELFDRREATQVLLIP